MTAPLAIDGGPPVRTAPLPTWPAPGAEEIAAVAEVARSGRLNYWTGEQGKIFESEYAQSLERQHGIALANGTLALELGLRAFGIGPGDAVIVPSRTFIATASAVVAVGAVPICADIDRDSSNLTAETVADVLTERTRAIIPVHLGGWPVDMDGIMRLAAERDLVVIEDCAQAHGATYRGRPVGALGSHAAAFSFCQDKVLPVGEGGMLVLDDDAAYEVAWSYKDHGKSYRKVHDPDFMSGSTSFKWTVDSFGSNWRLDEFSAAVGRVGLSKLPDWHAQRTRNALRLARGLSGIPALRVPLPPDDTAHAFYRFYTYVEPDALAPGWSRDRIATAITAEGVMAQYGGCAEIYREEAFASAGLAPAHRLPVAAEVHETSLAFLVHPTMGDADIDDTITAVHKVFEAASR
ncbi:MAG: DegT/DnrJ/EryC1/StrS aminotransferase family protein [Coriobacteriia bacterium]|nr:DegT/DnrJ/EryC1/StrS aminotransferase family protein [Coriobacteriia bacterium]